MTCTHYIVQQEEHRLWRRLRLPRSQAVRFQAPQIAIALAVVAAAILLARFILSQVRKGRPAKSARHPVQADAAETLRQVNKLLSLMTDDKGEPVSGPRCRHDSGLVDGHEQRFTAIETRQDTHGRALRKLFGGVSELRTGQNAILEHLTNGDGPKTLAPIDDDLTDDGE